MKKVLVATMITAMLVFSVALAGAVTVSLGTISGGSGSAISPSGSPYSFSGAFGFNNVGGAGSFASIFGDVGQFTFAANSAGTLPANDYSAPGSAVPGSSILRSNQQWIIGNSSVASGDSRLYGSVGSLIFGDGTVSGTLKTDGYIHWYYGYDDYIGAPNGKTPLASLGVSDTLTFSGTWSGTPASFSLDTVTVSASTVPIPGALILFGSGLLGLVGIGRKRLKG